MPYTTCAGVRIRFDVRGEGPPILFLHGLACGRRMWAGALRRLASDYRCIVPDFPGHGASSTPDEPHHYGEAAFARAALAVLDHLGIERAVVVGHSMGGGIAYELAIAHPARVAALCTVDTGSGSDDPAAYLVRTVSMSALLRSEGIAGYTETLAASPLMAPYVRRSRRAARHLRLLVGQHPAAGIARVIDGVNATRPATQDRALEHVSCPVLVINGALDESCLRSGRLARLRIAGAQLVEIAGAGHMLPLEDPHAFERVLTDWLRALRLSRD